MIQAIVKLIFRLVIRIAYQAYRAEGLNALFLVMPAKFVIPVLRKHGASIGENVELHTPIHFHNALDEPYCHYKNLSIGSNCYVGRDVFFDLAEKITLEDNVTISMRVTLLTHTHAGKSPLSEAKLPPSYAPIVLKTGCYLGAGAIILPGVTVGQNAIVGAGAVVTHSVPNGVTVVGVPAQRVFCHE